LSTAVVTVASEGALAQDAETTVLEGIVIYSANRTPTDAAKTGSSVTVITEQDIQAQSKTYLKDYLEQVTGVNLTQTGSPGGTTGISIRGANQSYVKVLVDGMDLSDPSGAQVVTQFEHLLVGDVSRIEVLKGPQSTLYGGDAVGGVISIDTKAATRPGFSQSGSAEYGTYNTARGAYTAGYAAANGSNIAFTVQGVDTDGFSSRSVINGLPEHEDDGYRNLTLSGRGEYFISDSVSLFFSARTLDARNEYDLSWNPLVTGDTVQHAGRAGANVSLLGGRFQNTFAVQGMKMERDDYEVGGTPGYDVVWYDSDRVKGEYKGLFKFSDQVSVLFGSDWERTGMQFQATPVPSDRYTAEIYGFYGQLLVEPIDGLQLTGGGRIDEHDQFGEFNTYRLTAAYNVPGTETILRGSYGTGFRAPSLYELFSEYGSADIQPEESKGWDVGFEQGFLNGKYKIGATYFELDTENLITFFDLFVPPYGEYRNVDGVTHRSGVELFAAATLAPGFVVSTGYTYVDTETADGERLARVPRHNLVASLDVKPIDKLSINVTAKYVADNLDRIIVSYPTYANVEVDDYFLLSAKVGYEVAPGWTAYVRGENLLDEDYVTVVTYNNPGLTVYGGLQFALPSD
jgi:vitamin B12 transporter